MNHAELAADEIHRALRGPAWHGSSLQELLAALSAEEAIQRPIPTAHNIWELVLHITSWSNIALRRITGGQVEPHEDEDWPVPGEMTSEQWDADREAMKESHERLTEVVTGLTDDQILAKAPKSSNSVAVMLHGVAQHDAYHGGQIALLRKVVTTKHRRAAI
ncbi:MAG: DinB family protein [Gemmatimonadales bacterium]